MNDETSGNGQAALTLEKDGDGVAWLVFDAPGRKVNVLSTPVMERLGALLDDVAAGAGAGGIRALVVRSGKDGTFIVGADVDEIAGLTDPAQARDKAAAGQAVFQRIHALDIPTIAAIDGTCLGGGTELALACDVRIASDRDETKIGLPEVRLGILPGFGGTTRLPRLIGLVAASDLILTGRDVDARKAEKLGLIHERMHQGALYDRARRLALELAGGESAPTHARPGLAQRALEATPLGRRVILSQARKQVLKQTGGHYPAPLRAIEVMRASAGKPLERALAIEAEALGELVVTDISKNLIHVFRLMEDAKKAAPAAEPRPVERVAVLGAGVMGGGVAQLLAYRGLSVRLKDINHEALSTGLRHAREQFDALVKRRKLRPREADDRMNAIAPSLDYTGFGTIDLVIEAVVERMDVKKSVLREAEAAAGDAILTTNTSSLSVSDMQRALERPADFAGMHFFNPVHKMPLVEVIRGEETSEEAVATVFALTRKLGKTPVIVQDGPGFLVNRVLTPYLNEAGYLLGEGASIAEIDAALVDFGMPMGPLRLLDEVGLDIARHAGRTMHAAFGARMAPAPALTALEGTDRLGRKNGRGFYEYEDGKEKHPDPAIYEELRAVVGDDRRPMAPRLIQDRCVLPMVNEAARILEEGIARSAGDVDLAMITGTGFPPFRGGLLRYADTLGTPTILAKLESLRKEHGPRFEPAPLLRRLADGGRGFYD
ncbi:MAG TPA: 3-hydroxyacyl-CoA dehydrogenase NAD-binding domain-containing protein [Longimicrobiales bacterium]|nr:3-hydroxyacyl-CoA dehydrogenase NAD-binding domain-containing protein [Longimicrobiales bacterium]